MIPVLDKTLPVAGLLSANARVRTLKVDIKQPWLLSFPSIAEPPRYEKFTINRFEMLRAPFGHAAAVEPALIERSVPWRLGTCSFSTVALLRNHEKTCSAADVLTPLNRFESLATACGLHLLVPAKAAFLEDSRSGLRSRV